MEQKTDSVCRNQSRKSMIKMMFSGIMATGAGMFGIGHAKSAPE
jgi:hypothetical protein